MRTASPVLPLLAANAAELAVKAACALNEGGLVAIPTDTIYGIAALAQHSSAVNRLYGVKNRSASKPVSICLAEVEDLAKWAHVTVDNCLLHRLLPGPVTLVFERRAELNPSLNPGTSLVGIRIPDHSFVREICRHANGPIALTSANVSNERSTLDPSEFTQLWAKVDIVVDGGRLKEEREGSTVVDLSIKERFKVIRDGCAREKTVRILEQFGLISIDN